MSIEGSTSKINIFNENLKMKCSCNYAWGNHTTGFLKTSNPLVEMTFSIHKHNGIIVLKKFMCLGPLTPN
jgi:hypothetical protein